MSRDIFEKTPPPPCIFWWHVRELPEVSRIICVAPYEKIFLQLWNAQTSQKQFFSHLQFSFVLFRITVKLGYNELGYNEHSVITNRFLSKIGHIST